MGLKGIKPVVRWAGVDAQNVTNGLVFLLSPGVTVEYLGGRAVVQDNIIVSFPSPHFT